MARSEEAGAAVARALLRWYARHGRDLPWRRTRDPYRILVSEMMLQQTTVQSVVPYFERFIAAFPDLATLAAAREEDLLRHWSGLGYYRRARNLLAAARIIRREHGGRVPEEPEALRRLPGIGPYTEAAIQALAFGRPAVALDGNLGRVLARLGAHETDPRSAEGARLLRQKGLEIVRAGDPAAVNQALMDLGASICTPGPPRCRACPLERCCRGRRAGIAERIPPPRRRSPTLAVTMIAGVVRRRGTVLVRRRFGALMEGLWEFPMVEAPRRGGDLRALDSEIRSLGGVGLRAPRAAGSIRHAVTNRRFKVRIVCGEATAPSRRRERSVAETAPSPYAAERNAVKGPKIRWIRWGGLDDLPLTGIARKIVRVVRRTERGGAGGSA